MIHQLVKKSNESGPANQKAVLLRQLRTMLEESFSLRYHGSQYGKLAHAQGYADGFMRALMDSGIVTEREILAFVQEVRRGQAGPATRLVEGDLEGDEAVFVA